MKTGKLHRKKGSVLLSFLLMSSIAVVIICLNSHYEKKHKLESAGHLIITEAGKLQYAIDSRIMNTRILEMLVLSHKGEVVDFEEIAELLYSGDSSVRSLQLAPDGVVSYVYPLKGNEKAFIDLFADPERNQEAVYARDSGQITLAGPFALAQGGMGLVARNPIFLTDENGRRVFWGFSIVVLNVPDIFNIANLDMLTSQNYDYRLWRYLPDSEEVQVISENTNKKLTGALRDEIEVPNAVWYLDLKPREGWISPKKIFLWSVALSLIVILTTLMLSAYLTVISQGGELIRQNHTDALTGIKNSRYFMDRLRELSGEHKPFLLFYLEMNNFKKIRDVYGRREGDKILIEMAKRMEGCIRNMDTVARIDGDEFALAIVADEKEAYCQELKERICKGVSKPYEIEGEIFYPDVSVGFARYPCDSPRVEELLLLADQRMNEEKTRKRQADGKEQ